MKTNAVVKNDTFLKNYYGSIEGIRMFASLGIVMMHILSKENSVYVINNFITINVIPLFTNFVFLFMIISGFSMCCGYYDKIMKGNINVATFYESRYKKIWPFFSMLVIIDLLFLPSLSSLIESFANLTLCFGLLPNANITVIGVGWFLGVVFLFYMLFPFFCFLLKTKKRAWLSFAISVIFNILCTRYFFNTKHVVEGFSYRSNFLYCSVFFLVGGLIYLYRFYIFNFVSRFRWGMLFITVLINIVYYLIPSIHKNDLVDLLWIIVMFSFWLMYALGTEGKLLNNKVTKFFSNISMEVYLCHMALFRLVEKMRLNYLFGYGWLSYFFTVTIVLATSIIFSICIKWGFRKVIASIKRRLSF